MPSNYNYRVPMYANDSHQPTTADEILDALSTEKMKEVCDRAWLDEKKKAAQAAQPKEMEKFFLLCPGYDESDDSSPNLIVADLMLRGIDRFTANALDFRESWNRVKAAGFNVKLKKSALQQRERQEIQTAAEEIEEREAFSQEEDLFTADGSTPQACRWDSITCQNSF